MAARSDCLRRAGVGKTIVIQELIANIAREHGGTLFSPVWASASREGNDLWHEMRESGVLPKWLWSWPDERARRRAPSRRADRPAMAEYSATKKGATCSSSSTTSIATRSRAWRSRPCLAACLRPWVPAHLATEMGDLEERIT